MIHCGAGPHAGEVNVTFLVAADGLAGRVVSVVGEFNAWDPAAHPLVPRIADGALHATVPLPIGRRHQFRYVTDTGCWFDDDGADGCEVDERGRKSCVLDLTDGPGF